MLVTDTYRISLLGRVTTNLPGGTYFKDAALFATYGAMTQINACYAYPYMSESVVVVAVAVAVAVVVAVVAAVVVVVVGM